MGMTRTNALLDMAPSLAAANVTDAVSGHTEASTELSIRFTSGKPGANLSHLIIGQDGFAVPLANGGGSAAIVNRAGVRGDPRDDRRSDTELYCDFISRQSAGDVTLTNGVGNVGIERGKAQSDAVAISSLSDAITHVVLVGTEKQMSRVHARRVVSAGAVVTDLKPFRDRAVVQFPRNAMRSEWALRGTGHDLTVAGRDEIANPQPARFSLLNLRPETLFEGISLILKAIGDVAGPAAKLSASLSKTTRRNLRDRAALKTGGVNGWKTLTCGSIWAHFRVPPGLPLPGCLTASRGFSLPQLYQFGVAKWA